jgi:hypothetical protein
MLEQRLETVGKACNTSTAMLIAKHSITAVDTVGGRRSD